MSEDSTQAATVVIHRAGSWTEAVVIRGLLRSEGIDSPAPDRTDPYPLRQPPKGWKGAEITVPAAQADAARRVIADYLASTAAIAPEDEETEPPAE